MYTCIYMRIKPTKCEVRILHILVNCINSFLTEVMQLTNIVCTRDIVLIMLMMIPYEVMELIQWSTNSAYTGFHFTLRSYEF